LSEEPLVVLRSPGACAVLSRGALVSIRRSPYTTAELSELCRVLRDVAPAHPRGIVSLTTFRLDPAFPIQADYEGSLSELAQAARELDRKLVAVASGTEFGGVRRAAMRAAPAAVWALARPRAELAQFESLSDALGWLCPRAVPLGALSEAAEYVRLHREVDRMLLAQPVAR